MKEFLVVSVGPCIVTARAHVRSLAWDFLHAMGAAKKKKGMKY